MSRDMSPCPSPPEDGADVQNDVRSSREAEQEEVQNGPESDHLSDSVMSSKRTVNDLNREEQQPAKNRSPNPRGSPALRPKNVMRNSTGERIVHSRARGDIPVVRRIQPSRDPKLPANDDSGDDESTCAVYLSSEDDDEATESLRARLRPTVKSLDMSNNDIKTNRSGSSSGSTITPSAFERQARGGGAESERADKQRKPDPLSFLEKDSPAVTEEHIRRVIAESGGDWSPRSASSSLSADSNSRRSVAETDSTTPDHSVNGDIQSTTFKQRSPSPSEGSVDVRRTSRARSGPSRQQRATSQTKGDDPAYRYGTPEMARGSAKHPHFPPSELQPRLSARGHGHTKHLPRAEKLPMSGYELLSAKLSNSSTRSRRRPGSTKELPTEKGEPRIKPIYRRFEALNHRLLLHLQDELSELEEQLHRLDTADTQTRRLQNCILPASRRAEFMAGGELQWHKTDLLGKIGFKLGQYNHVLSSFSETQSLPPASMSDVEDYRTYLATHNPIAEIETRFLDPAEDLVCLAPHRSPTSSYSDSSSLSSQYFPHSDDALTPMPRKMSFGRPSPGASGGLSSPRLGTSILNKKGLYGRREGQLTNGEESQLGLVACLAAVAVVGPVVAFPVVTDFLGRMAVVLVAGLAVAALRQKVTDTRVGVGGQSVKSEDVLPVVGVYAVVMVIIAAVL